jgi:transposase
MDSVANTNTVAGIDVAKDSLDLFILPTRRSLSVRNDADGIAAIVRAIRDDAASLAVLESTGSYQQPVVDALHKAEIPVAILNPRCVRDFAKASSRYAKTDRIDAEVLAEFGRRMDTRKDVPKSEQQQDLEDAMTRRGQLVKMLTAETNRRSSARSASARRSIDDVLKFLERQIEQLDKRIAEIIESDEGMKARRDLLKTMPGVGDKLAPRLVAELPELGEVNRREIAALAGVAPYDDSSGRQVGKRRVRGGRAGARSALYLAAWIATRWNPRMKAYADSLKARGKPRMVMLVACMRKLLTIMNSMIRTGQPWSATPV